MDPATPESQADHDDDAGRAFEEGFLVGVLVGEGHFGGDGRQPQVTLKMHVRHEPLFRWIDATFPGGRLYGPYHHSGRHFYQWMARGRFLRETVVPLLARRLTPALDLKAYDAFQSMRARYAVQLERHLEPGAALASRAVARQEGSAG